MLEEAGPYLLRLRHYDTDCLPEPVRARYAVSIADTYLTLGIEALQAYRTGSQYRDRVRIEACNLAVVHDPIERLRQNFVAKAREEERAASRQPPTRIQRAALYDIERWNSEHDLTTRKHLEDLANVLRDLSGDPDVTFRTAYKKSCL